MTTACDSSPIPARRLSGDDLALLRWTNLRLEIFINCLGDVMAILDAAGSDRSRIRFIRSRCEQLAEQMAAIPFPEGTAEDDSPPRTETRELWDTTLRSLLALRLRPMDPDDLENIGRELAIILGPLRAMVIDTAMAGVRSGK